MKDAKTMRAGHPARASSRPERVVTATTWKRLSALRVRLREYMRKEQAKHEARSKAREEAWARRRRNAADRRFEAWVDTRARETTVSPERAAQLCKVPVAAVLEVVRGTPAFLDFGVGSDGRAYQFVRVTAFDRLIREVAA